VDYEEQFLKGGLLVRVEAPAGVQLFDTVELELVTQAGTFVLPAQVVQRVPKVGVALSFDATGADLLAAVDEARDAGETAGGSPVHEIVALHEEAPRIAAATSASAPAVGTAAKIHLAQHGGKDDRMRIMREGDRSLHRYVLRNPGLRLDEVTFIAKMTSISVDLLKAIAERRDWAQRPEIATALVRNPKTPVQLAIQLLAHVGPAELRRLAKGQGARQPILAAARKKVVG
jgi:hypothetical protein